MNIQENLYKATESIYRRLEKELPQMEQSYEKDNLTTFRAQCGKCFPQENNSGFVFYGRSNNGWNPNCPLTMDGVVDHMHRPFFNLMSRVSEHFYPENWNNYVTWSNICKVVPVSKGNPSDNLWYMQYDYMVEILQKELEILSPKAVILVTGNTAGARWDAPLFEGNNLIDYKMDECEWIEGCNATLYKKDNTIFIITDRPERRAIEPHTNCIINLIEKYK